MTKTLVASAALLIAALLSACGSSSENAAKQTTSSTSPIAVKYIAVTPPDTARFLSGLKRGEPERAAKLTDAQSLELGQFACDGLVNGPTTESHQQVTNQIVQKLIVLNLDQDTANKLAPDIKSTAADDGFCRVAL